MVFRITRARDAFARIFFQRCFYLFVGLLVFIAIAPLFELTLFNRVVFNAIQLLVLVAAVAAVGRGLLPFLAASLLALPALGFQLVGLADENLEYLTRAWAFTAGFDALVVGYLLSYVFRDDVMTADKLYGAASAYLMLAVLWTYLYALVAAYVPGAFTVGGQAVPMQARELLYFSVTVLTSTGFGDIVPVAPMARSLVMLQQITGVLFIAILIARLAGIYPGRR